MCYNNTYIFKKKSCQSCLRPPFWAHINFRSRITHNVSGYMYTHKQQLLVNEFEMCATMWLLVDRNHMFTSWCYYCNISVMSHIVNSIGNYGISLLCHIAVLSNFDCFPTIKYIFISIAYDVKTRTCLWLTRIIDLM